MVLGVLALLVALVLVRVAARPLWTDLTGVLTGLTIVTITWSAVDPVAVPLSDMLVGLALVAALPGLIAGKWRFRLPAACLVGAVLVALSIVLNGLIPTPQAFEQTRHLTFGADPYDAVARQFLNALNGLKLLIGLVVIPVLVCGVARDRERLRAVIDLWVLSVVVASLVALSDFVGVIPFGIRFGLPFPFPGSRVSGLVNHPVHLATVCTMVLPFVLTWVASESARRRRSGIAALVVLAGAVFVSGSRAGMAVALLVVLAAAFVVVPLRRLIMLTAVPLGLVVVALLLVDTSLLTLVLEKTRIIGATASGSDAERALAVGQAVKDIQERPLLGIGYDIAGDGHSVYLQVIASGGLIALAGMVAYVIGVLRTTRMHVQGRFDELAYAAMLSVGAWFLLIVFENALVERYMYLPLTVLVVLAAHRADDELSRWRPAARQPAHPLQSAST